MRLSRLNVVHRQPKSTGHFQRLDSGPRPPLDFLSGPIQLLVMRAAEGHGEFIAHLQANALVLSEPTAANKAWLLGWGDSWNWKRSTTKIAAKSSPENFRTEYG
jgi:hypothetical protein